MNAAADVVEPLIGDAHDLERIGDLGGVGQHRVRGRPVRPGQVEGDPVDPCLPVLVPFGEPRARRGSVTARNDIEQLAVADELGRPQPLPVGAAWHERGLVQSEGGDRPDAVGVVHEREAVGDHGPVRGVPVTPEIVGDLRNRPSVTADLLARPPGGTIGHPHGCRPRSVDRPASTSPPDTHRQGSATGSGATPSSRGGRTTAGPRAGGASSA